MSPTVARWILAALIVGFRVPPLLNAAGTNSDAAIVGLQARHFLHFGLSPLLLGSTYQTSVDAAWAAPFVAVLPEPLALMLSGLSLYIALVLFAHAAIERTLGAARALVVVLPLVFTQAPVHGHALYPPRQMALTLAIAALWAIHTAPDRKRPTAAFGVGGLLAGLALFADPYAVVFLPGAFVLGLLAAYGGDGLAELEWRDRGERALATLFGAVVGAVPFLILLAHPRAAHGVLHLEGGRLAANFARLRDECLPWIAGTRVYVPRTPIDYVPWAAPTSYTWGAWIGAGLLAVLLVASIAVLFARGLSPLSRRLGIAGLVIGATTIGGFLCSPMVMDMFAARYLIALIFALPFVLAPLAELVALDRIAGLLAPFVMSSMVGGWASYGPYARGMMPQLADTGRGEEALEKALRDRGIDAAMADYWAAYRLAFLFGERIAVAPLHAREDRYSPYRERLARAKLFAYVYDPARSREAAPKWEARSIDVKEASSFQPFKAILGSKELAGAPALSGIPGFSAPPAAPSAPAAAPDSGAPASAPSGSIVIGPGTPITGSDAAAIVASGGGGLPPELPPAYVRERFDVGGFRVAILAR